MQPLAGRLSTRFILRKGNTMKTAMAMMAVATMALLVVVGCTSPKGGQVASGEAFKIQVPLLPLEIKQGDRQTITLSVKRGDLFKQDVKLEFKSSKGITVNPTSTVVKGSDTKDVSLQIMAPKDAALGDYRVSVIGTPQTGEATAIDIKVKVVAP
jgi:uncharacterized membrane protein